MTAASDAAMPHRVHSQAHQRIAELEQELAKMKASSTVNTAAAAFPFSNYGYNVEYCSEHEDNLRPVAVTPSFARPKDMLRLLAVTSSSP